MIRVSKMVSSAKAVNWNAGRWAPANPGDFPPWDSVKRAPMWSDPDWEGFRAALTKPLADISVRTTNDACTTIFKNAKKGEVQDETGPRAIVAQLERSLPEEFVQPYSVVCFCIHSNFSLFFCIVVAHLNIVS